MKHARTDRVLQVGLIVCSCVGIVVILAGAAPPAEKPPLAARVEALEKALDQLAARQEVYDKHQKELLRSLGKTPGSSPEYNARMLEQTVKETNRTVNELRSELRQLEGRVRTLERKK